MIEFSFTASKKEYRKWVWIHIYHTPFGILDTVAGAFILLITAFNYLSNPYSNNIETGIFLGLLLLLYPTLYVIITNYIRTNKTPQQDAEQTWSVDERMIKIQGNGFKSEFEWSKMYKIGSLEEVILLYNSRKTVFSYIPKRAFKTEADLNLFLDYARKNKVRVD